MMIVFTSLVSRVAITESFLWLAGMCGPTPVAYYGHGLKISRMLALGMEPCSRVKPRCLSSGHARQISLSSVRIPHDDAIKWKHLIFRVTGRLCGEFTGPR